MADMYLGGPIDQATGERLPDAQTRFDIDDFTTHGVIVGMTGSGKTGLGVIGLEEALRSGIPALVLDPKGDMTNLLLTFPELKPGDFEPWVEPERDESRETAAARAAELWSKGLASWRLAGSDIAALRAAAGFTIYTPGSTSGVPLNIIGSLEPPPVAWEDPEPLRDEIQGFTSGLLGLVGEDTDPVASRPHILIANLVEHAWRNGQSLTMETLLEWIQVPPLRRLGVFDVDTFFPEKDRTELALALNGLLASPGFDAWTRGPALDIDGMLWDDEGVPQAAIVYLAHLSDEERQFAVTLVLSRLVSWMRGQPGSDRLRALVYMDEVYGFVPPVAEPPAKRAILTIMKQARAFGIGMVLSTQNPVDLDYKAMSNAGTWCVGRLQTERDKARILEALTSVTGESDVPALDETISSLDKRQFVLHSVRRDGPELFTTRWAMSYLRGPLTRDQIKQVQPHAPLAGSLPGPSDEPVDEAASPTPKPDIMPKIPDSITVGYLSPSAPWGEDVGAVAGSTVYEAGLAVTVAVRYDERRANVDHTEAWEAIYHPLGGTFDADQALEVDHDDRDFVAAAPGAAYVPTDAPIETKGYFEEVGRAVKDHVQRTGRITVFRNPQLRLYSRVGEQRDTFEQRCAAAAASAADDAAAKLRDRYRSRLRTAQRALNKAEDRATESSSKARQYQQDAMLRQAGNVFDLLLGRKPSRSMTSGSRVRSAERSAAAAARRVGEERDDLAQIEEDLLVDLDQIDQEWQEKAAAIEEVEIGLERDDVNVESISLVWIPR
jgi:hypothetical protein